MSSASSSSPLPAAAAVGSIGRHPEYYTFALYFSEKKSKQLCQFLDEYPFVVTDANGNPTGESGALAPQIGGIDKRIRGVKLVVTEEEELYDAATPIIKATFVDNTGNTVDPSLVDVLLQKASVDKDEGRMDRIAAIQAVCDANGIRVVDPFETSLGICYSRSYCAERLIGGPAGDAMPHGGRTVLEMLDYWSFLVPSTYVIEKKKRSVGGAIGGASDDASSTTEKFTTTVLFEEPNALFKSDVVIVKPEVASQRGYSHDLQVVRTEDLMEAVSCDANGPPARLPPSSLVGTDEGCTKWVVQDCLSLLSLPTVYKVYVAGDYLSVMLYDARRFTEQIVGRVSNGLVGDGEGDDGDGAADAASPPPIITMEDGSKDLFKALTSLADRRAFQNEDSNATSTTDGDTLGGSSATSTGSNGSTSGGLHAECVNYFNKGTKNYDDLWQTVQFLKRPDNLGINFFGLDILVVKGFDGQRDRRYIVDVNYLPSYKNEIPVRLFPALLKTMMGIH